MHYYNGSEMIDVPALHVSTWYDPSVLESIDSFNYFREHAVTAAAAAAQYLIVSPTTHCGTSQCTEHTMVGDRDVGDARLPWYDICLRWFGHWLRDEANGITEMPRVQYYTMGSNQWQSAAAWPLPATVPTTYFLHSGGRANSRNGDGALSTAAPTAEPADAFTYDPGHPVPSVGGQRGTSYGTKAGAVDQVPNGLDFGDG
jgi:putative CocE/NonD family hydrolase